MRLGVGVVTCFSCSESLALSLQSRDCGLPLVPLAGALPSPAMPDVIATDSSLCGAG